METLISSNIPSSRSLILPPPPSSAGVPINLISPGNSELRAKNDKNDPTLVIAIKL